MKTTMILGITLAAALLSARVMATDFHALAALQGTAPVPLQEAELAGTEGGSSCYKPIGVGSGIISICALPLGDGRYFFVAETIRTLSWGQLPQVAN